MSVSDTVSERRLWTDIKENAAFGSLPDADHGRTVLCGTEANRRARERLVDRLEAAGLEVRVDAVGNIVGRWVPSSAEPGLAAVASGSHLDSVPEGGIFDGPLGVYAALEAVRAMQDAGAEPDRPVEVVSFTEEEGQRFASGLLGSSVAVGERSVEAALSLTDDGETLADALESIGFRGEGRIDAGDWDAWLELHVEQHTELESAGVPCGVVTDITGITHCEAVVEGAANHAGSTPMAERTDALAAASEFVLDAEREALERVESDESAVATIGSLEVSPNATNVVPGRVEMSVDVRAVEYTSMERTVAGLRESLSRLEAERDAETAFDRGFDLRPMPMSERVREAAHAAGDRAGVATMDLYSGAAHDSMYVADVTDGGMLFAPSHDGVSHNPAEWTDPADCAAATRVLAGALADLAGAE